jgi:putative transposase
VFCPKRRKPVLVEDIKDRFIEILNQVCDDICVNILASEIMPDHVHLALSVDPQFGINRAIKRIKGASSRYLRQEFPELLKLPSLWTNSYFVSTFGDVSKDRILEYIKRQK